MCSTSFVLRHLVSRTFPPLHKLRSATPCLKDFSPTPLQVSLQGSGLDMAKMCLSNITGIVKCTYVVAE